MGALMSVVISCRASRGDLRGGLRGSAVDKFGCALCVGCGGEHCSIISRQHFQPVCDIGRVIFAGLKSKLQIGAHRGALPEGIDLPRLCACAAEEKCGADLSAYACQPRAQPAGCARSQRTCRADRGPRDGDCQD
jgi:hypothetical protein